MIHGAHRTVQLQGWLLHLGWRQWHDDAQHPTCDAHVVCARIGHQNHVHLLPPLGLQVPDLLDGVLTLQRGLEQLLTVPEQARNPAGLAGIAEPGITPEFFELTGMYHM